VLEESIRLYTDENMNPDLARALVERGYDALSCHEAGNANPSMSDEWQTEWASSRGRAILSANVWDFMMIATLWSQQDRTHSGILVIRHLPLSEQIRRTSDFLERYSAAEVRNTRMWVS
jgi:predicted nuclease of predicted toxin-antitoxin system